MNLYSASSRLAKKFLLEFLRCATLRKRREPCLYEFVRHSSAKVLSSIHLTNSLVAPVRHRNVQSSRHGTHIASSRFSFGGVRTLYLLTFSDPPCFEVQSPGFAGFLLCTYSVKVASQFLGLFFFITSMPCALFTNVCRRRIVPFFSKYVCLQA